MSHTSRFPNGWIAIHNSDYSGPITLLQVDPNNAKGPPLQEMSVPFAFLVGLVGNALRTQYIGELESSPAHAVIGLNEAFGTDPKDWEVEADG